MRWMTWRAISVRPYVAAAHFARRLLRRAAQAWLRRARRIAAVAALANESLAGDLLRTSTRPTLNLLLLLLHVLCRSVCACTLKVNHALILV
jgi:hypothetical protein